MNSIYQCPIHKHFTDLRETLCSIIEKVYSCPDKDKGDIAQIKLLKDKREATNFTLGMCSAIEHKIELLNYKLQLIKTFDWGKRDKFEEYKRKSSDKSVEQVLQDGKLRVKFLHEETMTNFIYTEISTFFSIITSIIDNIAEILYYEYRLNFKYTRTIKNVAKYLKEGKLKSFIQQKFCDDYGFYGVREIRNIFEHKNHTEVIHIDDIKRSYLFRRKKKEVIVANLNVELMSVDLLRELNALPDGNRLDSYCKFLYEKIIEALREFIVEVSKEKLL